MLIRISFNFFIARWLYVVGVIFLVVVLNFIKLKQWHFTCTADHFSSFSLPFRNVFDRLLFTWLSERCRCCWVIERLRKKEKIQFNNFPVFAIPKIWERREREGNHSIKCNEIELMNWFTDWEKKAMCTWSRRTIFTVHRRGAFTQAACAGQPNWK